MMTSKNILSAYNGFIPQFLAVFTATLNSISDGMNFAWSSPMIPRLKKENSPIEISETDETWLEITLMLAGLVGLPLTTYLVDKIGRKQSTLTASATCVVGWTLIAVANNVIYLYIARFMMGVASDIAFISSPMYIAEISHQSFRGFLSGTIYVMSMTGSLIMYIIGPYVAFYVPSIVAGVFLITQLITLPFMPDSPYFLIMKDKKETAKDSLRKLRGHDDIDKEIDEISSFVDEEKRKEKGRVSDLFTVPSIRKAVIIMSFVNAGQHLGGFTAISMNCHSILERANSKYLDEETTVVLFASLMLCASISAILLVDKFGRRTLLISSTISTGITLTATGIYFYLQVDNDVSNISWIPVVSIMAFAVTFKFGLGTVPIVLTAELFPASVKAYGMASADGMYVVFSSVSLYFYGFLKDNPGMYMPFFFFAGCCFITGLFVALVVPETKGRTLEEVQTLLK